MAEITIDRRDRNGETWLTGPDPLDAALDATERHAIAGLLSAAARDAFDQGATGVHWESDGAAEQVDEIAGAVGLTIPRDIHRMERDLPLGRSDRPEPVVPPPPFRALRPGTADERAWVLTNNRAFARHPDQGAETLDSLRAAMAEPWFDATGFVVLDGDPTVDEGGRLDGFCWTKVHSATDTEPAAGEIYVIGVDPAATGRGLGPRLVEAGLDHLAGLGITRALLYVDADNTGATAMYDRLGFVVASTRRVRSIDRP